MNTTSDQQVINEKKNTICWHCANACGGCSWSDELIPVDGWNAVETRINCIGQGFIVMDCPQYIEEKSGHRKRPDEFDPDGCERLIQRMAAAAADDYIKISGMRSEVTRWFRSAMFANLSGANPEVIISKLREMAREHDKKIERSIEP